MKKLLIMLALILLASPLWAAGPYLACDWVDGMTASEVEVNGNVIPGTVVQSGSDMILLDLDGYANGWYVFKVRFVSEGGWPSDWSVPLSAEKPAGAGGLRIKR